MFVAMKTCLSCWLIIPGRVIACSGDSALSLGAVAVGDQTMGVLGSVVVSVM